MNLNSTLGRELHYATKQSPAMWDPSACPAFSFCTFFSGTERTKKRGSCLSCVSKSHSPAHYLITSSGSLQVGSELPLTLTNLFEERSQLHICPWKKINKRSLCQIFFGRSQARGFCLSRLGGLWRDWRAPLALAVPLRWQEPCLPRTAVSHSVTDWVIPEKNATLGISRRKCEIPRVWGGEGGWLAWARLLRDLPQRTPHCTAPFAGVKGDSPWMCTDWKQGLDLVLI